MTPAHPDLGRFRQLVADADPPLAEGGALIARHLGSSTTVEGCLADLDALAVAVGVASGPGPTLEVIVTELRSTFGFRGNHADYYDLRNSLLPEVLRRRLGIPITLAIVIVEVAERLGVAATVVGMPGHVLVGDGARPTRWLDPFDGGGWLDREGAGAIFARVHGGRGRFDASLLAPTPKRLVLLRVIENLVVAARGQGDATAMVRAVELRSAVPGFGEGPSARIALAEAYAAVGRWADAISSLELASAQLPPDRRDPLEARIATLRASAN